MAVAGTTEVVGAAVAMAAVAATVEAVPAMVEVLSEAVPAMVEVVSEARRSPMMGTKAPPAVMVTRKT